MTHQIIDGIHLLRLLGGHDHGSSLRPPLPAPVVKKVVVGLTVRGLFVWDAG